MSPSLKVSKKERKTLERNPNTLLQKSLAISFLKILIFLLFDCTGSEFAVRWIFMASCRILPEALGPSSCSRKAL